MGDKEIWDVLTEARGRRPVCCLAIGRTIVAWVEQGFYFVRIRLAETDMYYAAIALLERVGQGFPRFDRDVILEYASAKDWKGREVLQDRIGDLAVLFDA